MKYVEFQRTPIEVADDIRDYLKGKSVIDIGAGDGSFMLAMRQYADKVAGIEIDESIEKRTNVKEGNFIDEDLSEYDIIFCFLNFFGMSALTNKLLADDWSGIVISYYYPLHKDLSRIMNPIEIRVSEKMIPILIYNL